ncbi:MULTISPECIES: phage terminase large subunit [Bacillus]|uniref:phage terminase large subunit n=1 Tax=Bacillus TaxID=1386 RepID=UPI0012988C38|nr:MULTISPECIES: phage terminase large subunit [Bacillus]MCR6838090.1 phage terminase large subunit [Bacillus thuringiensis]MDA2540189.1 phage terminase large subunit [Bacillus cereus]MDA2611655.1 phage terminase large subunit [Bacillus cereus]MDY7951878.1 phage terminase large subunit [Bacillus thuringiensis]MEB8553472.1 phage terminase large subunit [Bacillus cereus]
MSQSLPNLPTVEEIQREIARRDYYEYVCYVHEGRYKKAPHSEFVGGVIQEAIDKKKQMNASEIPTTNQYIAINMPPRHSKSMTITETLPSYYLGNFPEDRVIEISYSDTFARRFGKKNKEKVKMYGTDLFDIQISKESSAHDEWLLDNEIGGMISRGVLSGITGMGADLMIIDDPIKNREEADSETHRGKIWDEWIDSFSTRLHPGAIVILILTRWHEDDLQGRLLSKEYGEPLPWQVYNLPLEAEEDDVIGRAVGEPLWPERYGLEFIQERKRYPSSFNSLYQGRPTAAEGNLLKRKWWQYYDTLPKMVHTIMSIDATFKDEADSDFVCIQVWGKNGADMYLIDNLKARMNFPTTLQAIRNMVRKYPKAHAKLVEDKANGPAIISMLKNEIGGMIPVNPQGGKVSRVNAVSPYIESGNVYLPRQAPWVHDFVEECASFPQGKNDDQVDAMSQALNRFIYYHANEKFIPKEPVTLEEKVHRHIIRLSRGRRKGGQLQ